MVDAVSVNLAVSWGAWQLHVVRGPARPLLPLPEQVECI